MDINKKEYQDSQWQNLPVVVNQKIDIREGKNKKAVHFKRIYQNKFSRGVGVLLNFQNKRKH